MDRQYDLVVIGTGVASKAASRCRAAGWTVAVVDSRPFGGTCALRGCVPKKILVAAGEAVHAARALNGKGIYADGVAIDWPERMRVKRWVTDPSPQPLTFPGAEHVATSDRFLDLDALPQRIVFIGGGFISFEFAHLAARAGVRATIVHRGTRPLEAFDPDLVDQLVARSRELGISVELAADVRAVEPAAGKAVAPPLDRSAPIVDRNGLLVARTHDAPVAVGLAAHHDHVDVLTAEDRDWLVGRGFEPRRPRLLA